jgi:AbrB family looped-hinge helix DNA binding protein
MMVVEKKARLEASAKITSKGQITLPKAVRERLGLRPGDQVLFVEDEQGIHLRGASRLPALRKWAGYLERTNPLDMTVDEYIALARGRDDYRD